MLRWAINGKRQQEELRDETKIQANKELLKVGAKRFNCTLFFGAGWFHSGIFPSRLARHTCDINRASTFNVIVFGQSRCLGQGFGDWQVSA
jgi:hypothetical protein